MKRLRMWTEGVGLPPVLLRFLLLVAAMSVLSLLYTQVMTHVFGLGYPYGSPLFFRDDRWFDFTVYHDRFQVFRTAAFWSSRGYPFTYPALLGVVYATLYTIPHALRYYLLGYAGFVCGAAWLLLRALLARGIARAPAVLFVAILVATSYPLRCLFESANTEGIVAILSGLGIYALLRERYWLAAALIGSAGSMKLCPFVLLALLLSRRRYREFAFGGGFAATLNLASLAIMGPTVREAQRHIADGVGYVKYTYICVVSPVSLDYNHSLFTIVRFAVALVSRHLHPTANLIARAARERQLLDTTFNVYVLLAGAFGVVAYFVWIRRLPLLNQIIALSVCAIVLPPLSADYTLIHLLYPFALLCIYAADRWREGMHVPRLLGCFTCFAFIFAYQTYLTLQYRFSCEVRTFAMIVLFVLVVRHPFGPGLDVKGAGEGLPAV